MPRVSVVVVSYNSRRTLTRATRPLLGDGEISVVVVDNASSDSSLETLAGTPVETISLEHNGGFAHGCNVGWRRSTAEYILFLNPDATIEPPAVHRLAMELDEHPDTGAVAPRIYDSGGATDFSLRRFPRLRSTFAQAFFLHRLFGNASWVDEVVRDEDAYTRPGTVDWVSGACVMVRRALLDRLGGFDEGYFHYCEDIDLCRRIWDAGSTVRYLPEATATHVGGASAPRAALLPVLAAARIRYARLHRARAPALFERIGVGLGAATHALLGKGGRRARAGHVRALGAAFGVRPAYLADRPGSSSVDPT